MKNTMAILGVFIIALTLSSCGGNSKNDKQEKSKDDNTVKITVDTIKKDSVIKTEQENIDPQKEEAKETETVKTKIVPANITCSIYFQTRDMSGYEGYEDYEPIISERERFRKNKSYTFCYDSEEFHHITLTGTGENFTFQVFNGDKNV